MEKYDANSIDSLSFREAVRTRVHMYLGSDNIEGTYQAFKEIINNSTDEAIQGFGNKIEIEVNEKDNSIMVRDYGRGVPFGINDKGKNVLVAVYTESHTGGKFNSNVYKNSSGLNGVGGSCVCLSSKKFFVRSVRDGKVAYANFIKGKLDEYIEEDNTYGYEKGTTVCFVPDEEVFSNGKIGYSYERICEEIKNISYLYNNLTFEVKCGKKVKSFFCKDGIAQFVRDNVKKPMNKAVIVGSETDGTDSVEIAFQWGVKREKNYVFANGLRCPEGGSPITGAKSAIVRTINNITGEDFDSDKVRENLFYVINCRVANPSFEGQTKSKVNNASLRALATTAFTNAIKDMSIKYPDDFKALTDYFRKIMRADAAAEKARTAVLSMDKKENEYKRTKIAMPDKFKDCEKHGENSMLIIAEGNSALSGLMPARDVNTEALYAVRGKVKNALKSNLAELLKNQEISDIILALGCGIQSKYNSKKLNYGKVAIAVDADADGFNIMCLITTMFYVLMPDFIKEKRLCWLRAPLYRLTKGKQRVFAYDDTELEELKKTHKGWEQGRNKGLGEMTPEDMESSMMHPTDRRLEVLTINDAELAAESIKMLMGRDTDERKKFLFDNVDFSVINR